DGERLEVTQVVGHAVGEDGAGLLVQPARGRELGLVAGAEVCHRWPPESFKLMGHFRLARNSTTSRSSRFVKCFTASSGIADLPRARSSIFPFGIGTTAPSAVISFTSLASSALRMPLTTVPFDSDSTTDSYPCAICLLGSTMDSRR